MQRAEPPDRDLEAEAAHLTALQHQAMDGDAGALGELRKILDADPNWWRQSGDIAHQAAGAWLQTIAGRDEFAREIFSRKMRELTRELRGPDPTPLERLLVDRIVLNWLTLYYAESQYARKMGSGEGMTLELSTHCQERVDRCQKRYLASIRALAQLRRVSLTAVRVLDPAGRQVEAAQVSVDGR